MKIEIKELKVCENGETKTLYVLVAECFVTDTVKKLESENATLQAQVNALLKANSDIGKRFEEISKQPDSEQLRAHVGALVKANEQSHVRIVQLEQKHKNLEDANKRLEMWNNRQAETIKDEREKLHSLAQENRDLRAGKVHAQLSEHTLEIDMLKAQVDGQRANISKLCEKIASRDAEIETLKGLRQGDSITVERMSQEIAEKDAFLVALKADYDRARDARDTHAKALKGLMSTNENLNDLHKGQRRMLAERDAQIKILTTCNENQAQQIQDNRASIEHLEAQVKCREAGIETQRVVNSELSARVEHLSTANTALTKFVDVRDATIKGLTDKISAHRTIIDTRDMMIKSLEETLANVKSDYSKTRAVVAMQDQRIKDLTYVRQPTV